MVFGVKSRLAFNGIFAAFLLPAVFGCGHPGAGRASHFARGGSFLGADPFVSPDGEYVIFATPETGNGDIYRLAIAGKTLERLTNDPLYEGQAEISPDGKAIVFVREDGGGRGRIFMMSLENRKARQITFGPHDDSNPSFSPDGTSLVIQRKFLDGHFSPRSGAANEIVVIRLSDFSEQRLTDNDIPDGAPVFSPDGQTILFTRAAGGESELRLKGLDGGKSRRITQGSFGRFSPDGRRIVFVAGPFGRAVGIVNLDGSNRKVLAESETPKSHPMFMPDGRSILFVDHTDRERVGQIVVLDVGNKSTIILHTLAGSSSRSGRRLP